MRKTRHRPLLQLLAFFVFIFNTQFTYVYASAEDESKIDDIIKTRGKNNVVQFLLQKRDGKITIQKKKSFLNVSGRPDTNFITPKSVNNDLKIIKIDISDFETELDNYIKITSKKQLDNDSKLSDSPSTGNHSEVPQSKQLKYQIRMVKRKYDESENEYERKQLKYKLSGLQRKYKEAKYNEKYHFSDKPSSNSQNKRNTYRNASYCNNAKAQLRKLTETTYRHQIFFCSDISYRSKNPKSCGKYKYSKQYSLKEYKDQLNKLRKNVASSCGS